MNLFSQYRSSGKQISPGVLLLDFFLLGVAVATPVSDKFIRGYDTAILQRNFQIAIWPN